MGATFHVSISPTTADMAPSRRVLARGLVAKPQFSIIVMIIIMVSVIMSMPATNLNCPANLAAWEQAIGRSGRVNIDVGDSRADCFEHLGKFTCGDPLSRRSYDVSGDDGSSDSNHGIGIAGWGRGPTS